MNKKLIKRIIFSDVDGTIYGFPHKKLLPPVKESVLNAIKQYDIEFVLDTGNPPFKKIIDLANNLYSRYAICANGAAIFDVKEQKFLNIFHMDLSETKKLFDIVLKNNGQLYYFGINKYYLYNITPDMKEFLTNFNEYSNWVEDGSIPEDIYKVEVMGDFDIVKNIYESIKDTINLNIIYFGSHIEITAKNIDKGSGIKWMCDNVFNADINHVMSIGDGDNDIAMFQNTGYSYAMDNALPRVKSHAKYYTSDVNQNGLGEAINDYIFRTSLDIERQEKEIRYEKQKLHGKY
ncbi:Cof-type HAD-IIB family hydrolase [Mycoplasmopsis lipofaciens]|uniref:Cof-type HAD-IIB family hydrolase n=1 Tax=Mycoplasmopsis lipofaciens TaxID=114884 RepID=UPI00055D24B4|nr:Cof-type HAD-IIB family hydrolase [Mycoplasmopsis lipofaciens]